MINRVVMVLALIGFSVLPTAAAATSHLDLEAELSRWSGPLASSLVLVSASSDVLWSGRLEVSVSGVQVVEPVELPAGTEKAWEVVVPPSAGASRITVRLLDDEGESGGRVQIPLPSGGGGPRVAVLDASVEVLAAISGARVAPTGSDPQVTGIGPDELGMLDGYDYLVLTEPLAGSGEVATVEDWVRAGGRVIGVASAVASFAGDLPAGDWGDVQLAPLGWGEIITIPSEHSLVWGLALRDVGSQLNNVGLEDQFGDPYRSLGEAATGSGDALALIPWLLPALGIYVLVAGPVNLLVLRRLGHPQLAWATIPVIAFVGVAGLWFFGPREGTVIARHATIVTDAGEHVGVSVVASSDGDRSVGIADPTLLGVVSDLTTRVLPVGDDTLNLGLLTGRTVTVYGQRPAGSGSLGVTVEDGLVTLTNLTDATLEQWGVALGSKVVGSNGELGPGEADTFTIDGFVNEDPWEPLLMQKLWEDPFLTRGDLLWRAYRPLLGASERLVEGVRTESFAWAITGSHTQEVTIDGDPESVAGITLYLYSIDAPPERVEATRGVILATDGLRQEGPFFLWGLGSVTLEFRAAPAAGDLQLTDQFGGFGRTLAYSAFNPSTGDWDEIGDTGTAFAAAAYVTPTGDLYLRVSTEEDREIDLQGLVVEASR